MTQTVSPADLSLARRLEHAEAASGASYVDTLARIEPASRADWVEIGGAYALFAGSDSPVTQTFGLGLFEPVTHEVLTQIEAFFADRDAPVFHEVSPLAGAAAFELLCRRGYVPVELTSVLYLPLDNPVDLPPRSEVEARRIAKGEEETYAQVAVRGWGASGLSETLLLDLMRVGLHDPTRVAFLARREGEAIAAGMLSVQAGVAHFAGACTVPEHRRRGAQSALLTARFSCARECGCDLAMIGAAPGSASQRNAERLGFRIAYTRVKWHRSRSG